MKYDKLRMYILVKDSVPDDYVPLMVAHAVTQCILSHESFRNIHNIVLGWYDGHNMAKVICRVNEQEFDEAVRMGHNSWGGYIIQSETSGLDPEHLTDCVIAFVPRYEYPDYFREFKLWKVRKTDSQKALDVINAEHEI